MSYVMFARWFGIVSIILSLGILFNLEDAKNMANHMIKSESGYIMGAVLPTIFGTLALMFSTEIRYDWSLLMTLIGSAMLAAGLYRAWFVSHWKKIMYRHVEQIPFLFSLFGLMFGVVLIYVGYIHPFID